MTLQLVMITGTFMYIQLIVNFNFCSCTDLLFIFCFAKLYGKCNQRQLEKSYMFSPYSPIASKEKTVTPTSPIPYWLSINRSPTTIFKTSVNMSTFHIRQCNSLFEERNCTGICFTKQDLQHPSCAPWFVRFHIPAWDQTINTSRNT